MNIRNFISTELSISENAENLFKNFLFKIGETCYLLGEIEFYLNDNGNHIDPFVHCNSQQLEYGKFYYHREPLAKLGFTLKGLDFTYGNKDKNIYAGILIRAIYNPKTGEYIDGPSKVVDEILTKSEVESVSKLKEYQLDKEIKLVYNKNTNKRLWEYVNSKNPKHFDGQLYVGRRIGLKISKKIMVGTEQYKKMEKYQNALYRYCVFRQIKKKEKTKLKSYFSLI